MTRVFRNRFKRTGLLTKFKMQLAFVWCCMFSISLLASFPGEGPGMEVILLYCAALKVSEINIVFGKKKNL